MAFEIDPPSSNANLRKHGIDFLEAQDLWLDPAVLEIPARTLDALRFLVIGRLQGHHWSAVITYHRLAIRMISVRRSLHEEVQLYEKL